MNSLRGECGCSMGTWFLVAALVLYAGFWLLFLHSFVALWQAILLGAVVLFLALGMGKFTGVRLARFKLHGVIRELRARSAIPREGQSDD